MSFLVRFANRFKPVYENYRESVREIGVFSKQYPKLASAIFVTSTAIGASGYTLLYTNPGKREFNDQLREISNELALIPASLRNTALEIKTNRLLTLIESDSLKFNDFGFFTLACVTNVPLTLQNAQGVYGRSNQHPWDAFKASIIDYGYYNEFHVLKKEADLLDHIN